MIVDELSSLAERRLGSTLLRRILRHAPENPIQALRVARYEARRIRETADQVVALLAEARTVLENELLGQGIDEKIIAKALRMRTRDGSTIANELRRWEQIADSHRTAEATVSAV